MGGAAETRSAERPIQPRVRLSSPLDALKPHYDVVVVGSGYGGSIAASRMARAGRTVCLLERGRELQPGEYPDSAAESFHEFQIDTKERHFGRADGLFDMRVNDDMNVLVGCGLGGTSLVNANVALPAEARVWEDERWPQALRDDRAGLDEGYRRATEMLKPAPFPQELAPLPKLAALEAAAAAMDARFYRPPINVTYKDGTNHVGVYQQACHLCGDCVSGCNYGAKNTTLMNYLPDARNHGAELFTQVRVDRVDRRDGRWVVYFRPVGSGREAFGAPPMFVTADIVMLGAGALGSTEILLRSRAAGLPLSDVLGHRFTGNGDVLGFGYNCDRPINGIGFGDHAVGELPPVGPCITGIIDLREQPVLEEGMVIEEGVVPGGLSPVLARVFEIAAALVGKDTDDGVADFFRERAREIQMMVQGPYRGALQNTITFLVMGHDDGEGRLVLDDGRVRVEWPGVGSQPIFQRVAERLTEATAALGGEFVKNPIWSKLLHHDLVTVHPLGGCPMGEDAAGGVVDADGRVFAGGDGSAVHEGLYVCDGAIVPRPLGVNPLLTISALAERICDRMAARHGWTIDYGLAYAPPRQAQEPVKPGIQFTETMRGFFAAGATGAYEDAERRGREEDSPFEFTLTIVSDDLERMLEEQEHAARIFGTVKAPALSPSPLTVTDGVFNLFVTDLAEPDRRLMRYRMGLAAEDGKRYFFDGFKRIEDDPGLDMWADTTTLYITVHEGGDDTGPVAGKGVLHIHPRDFMRQMTTMRVRNALSARQQLALSGRFSALFTGSLHDVYGLG
ncbi:MAG: GMC oxidoreductase [Gaiellaceae bacterium]